MKNWYKSELAWLLISMGLALLLIILSIFFKLPYWVFIPSFAYMGYFTIKGIIYAWIINPYNAWKNKEK